MGIYNTVSFNRDDNHFKGFSSPTNIYPGPAAHTALYLGIERNLITISPREDKSENPESCCHSHLAWLALWSCPWPLGSLQRPFPSPFMGKAASPAAGSMGWGWSQENPRRWGGLTLPLRGQEQWPPHAWDTAPCCAWPFAVISELLFHPILKTALLVALIITPTF